MNNKNILSKHGWLISLTIGLVLIIIGMVTNKRPYPFYIFIGYMLITLDVLFSVFGIIEKLNK